MRKFIYCLAAGLLIANLAIAQGCSDAGFCTLGNLAQQRHDTTASTNKVSLIFPLGVGDGAVFVFTPALQYERQLNKHWLMQSKITANYAQGSLDNIAGPGDLFLSGTYVFTTKRSWVSTLMVGTKLPMNSGNLKKNERSLPMQYQSSLGTVDFIAGVQISNKHFQFAAGWQQPLSSTNGNQFLPAEWSEPDAQLFPPTNNFKRRADALLRGSYTHTFSDFLELSGGLLGIYHLDEDQFTDENNKSQVIEGSDGLTLNITLRGKWSVNKNLELGFMAGVPLVVRSLRPDGLTRSFVFAPEISWKF
jgi:hypothetical protein